MHALMTPVLLRVIWLEALDRLLKLKEALLLAKGRPLSVRSASGTPECLKSRSNTVEREDLLVAHIEPDVALQPSGKSSEARRGRSAESACWASVLANA
jgi:hypothetical protein